MDDIIRSGDIEEFKRLIKTRKDEVLKIFTEKGYDELIRQSEIDRRSALIYFIGQSKKTFNYSFDDLIKLFYPFQINGEFFGLIHVDRSAPSANDFNNRLCYRSMVLSTRPDLLYTRLSTERKDL